MSGEARRLRLYGFADGRCPAPGGDLRVQAGLEVSVRGPHLGLSVGLVEGSVVALRGWRALRLLQVGQEVEVVLLSLALSPSGVSEV